MKRLGFPLLAAIVLLLGLVHGAGPAGPPAGSRVHTVRIENMVFSPAEISVRPGDTVEFRNLDLVPHTVTERSIRQFDSGMINPKATWKLVCPDEGLLEYRCLYHPTMLGAITVAASGSALSRARASLELCGTPEPVRKVVSRDQTD